MYVPSSELGFSHPLSRQRVCPSPWNQRGGTLACGWGVGGVPIPTTGDKLSTLPTLWFYFTCTYTELFDRENSICVLWIAINTHILQNPGKDSYKIAQKAYIFSWGAVEFTFNRAAIHEFQKGEFCLLCSYSAFSVVKWSELTSPTWQSRFLIWGPLQACICQIFVVCSFIVGWVSVKLKHGVFWMYELTADCLFQLLKVLSNENRGGWKPVNVLLRTLKMFMFLSWWGSFGAGKGHLPYIKMDRLIPVSIHLCFHQSDSNFNPWCCRLDLRETA